LSTFQTLRTNTQASIDKRHLYFNTFVVLLRFHKATADVFELLDPQPSQNGRKSSGEYLKQTHQDNDLFLDLAYFLLSQVNFLSRFGSGVMQRI